MFDALQQRLSAYLYGRRLKRKHAVPNFNISKVPLYLRLKGPAAPPPPRETLHIKHTVAYEHRVHRQGKPMPQVLLIEAKALHKAAVDRLRAAQSRLYLLDDERDPLLVVYPTTMPQTLEAVLAEVRAIRGEHSNVLKRIAQLELRLPREDKRMFSEIHFLTRQMGIDNDSVQTTEMLRWLD